MRKLLLLIPILFLSLSVLSSDASEATLYEVQEDVQIQSTYEYEVVNCPALNGYSITVDSADASNPMDYDDTFLQDTYEVLWNKYEVEYQDEDGPKLSKEDFFESIELVQK